MLRSNLHTHTLWCDGKNTPREMVERAIDLGFDTLGFSGHSYTSFDTSFCLRDPQGYTEEILALQKEYEGRIKVLLGVELDALGECTFDPAYVIGAVHYVTARGMHYPIDHNLAWQKRLIEEGYHGDVMSAVAAYFHSLPEMAYRIKPDFVAHMDVFAKFNEQHPAFDETGDEYLTLAFEAVEGIMEHCRVFEVNTGGMFRGYRSAPYTTLPILKHIQKCGGEVTISSDAHKIEALDYGFREALGVISRVGFDTLRVMTPAGWVKMPIEEALLGYEL